MMKSLLLYIGIIFSSPFFSSAQEIVYDYDIHHSLIENKGQWHPDVLFQSEQAGGNLWIHKNKLVYHLQDYSEVLPKHHGGKQLANGLAKQTVVHLNFLGSNGAAELQKQKQTANYNNYFIGNEPDKWGKEAHGFHEARLRGFYQGIDIVYRQEMKALKYDFVVQPNADPKQILLQYVGQKKLKLDRDGNLHVITEIGEIIEEKPLAYQIINGNIRNIKCDYSIEGNKVQFKLGNYRSDLELVIDPELIFATYCGSVTDNFGMTATYAYDGSAISGGTVFGNAYPTPDNNAYDVTGNFTVVNAGIGTTDVFISKYSPDGTNMLWTSFLGGGNNNQGTETVHSLICDFDDNVYMYGVTSSTDFPTVNAFQNTFAGGDALNIGGYGTDFKSATTSGTDIYVAKLSTNGYNLMGSTYYGGSKNDGVNYDSGSPGANANLTTNYGDHFRGEIMLGPNKEVIVASSTHSTNFPTLNPFQAANAGQQDGVLFCLSNNLSAQLFSTYYGGALDDACYSVKVDSAFNIVFAGGTRSLNLSGVTGKYQSSFQGGAADGFIGKTDLMGSSLLRATYIGTSNYDQVFFTEIDRNNKIFIYGQSRGGDFPVVNAAYSNPNSNHFIAKLDENLLGLENSTVIGEGNNNTLMSPTAFLIDRCGNIFISGWGQSPGMGAGLIGFPTTSDALQQTPSSDNADFFLFVMDRSFSNMIYGSHLGGGSAREHVDGGTSRFDRAGVVYQSVCGGCGGSSDFPTTAGAWSNSNLSSNCNNLVFKFDFQLDTHAEFTFSDTLACAGVEVQLLNNSTSYSSFFWVLDNGDTSYVFEPLVQYDLPGTYEIKLIVTDSTCLTVDTALYTVTVGKNIDLSTNGSFVFCNDIDTMIVADSKGEADFFIWSTNRDFTDTLNVVGVDSNFMASVNSNRWYYVYAESGPCNKMDSVQFTQIQGALTLADVVSICSPESGFTSVELVDPTLNFQYTWTPAIIIQGPNDEATVTFQTDSSQYIHLTAFFNSSCIIEDSFFVDVHTLDPTILSATAVPDTLPMGGMVQLNVQPSGYSYIWTPESVVSDVNAQSPTAKVDQNTKFDVLISDGVCAKNATVSVVVYDFICGRPGVYVPNAFSPNGDGNNDVLYVRSPIVNEVLFRVFSRWGELLFETTEMSKGWDGRHKGKLMDPDTYDYYLKVVCVDGQENMLKGNVTLLR